MRWRRGREGGAGAVVLGRILGETSCKVWRHGGLVSERQRGGGDHRKADKAGMFCVGVGHSQDVPQLTWNRDCCEVAIGFATIENNYWVGLPKRDFIGICFIPFSYLADRPGDVCEEGLFTPFTLHHTTLHCTTQHYTVLRNTTQHFTVLNNTTQHFTVLHNTTQHSTAMQNTKQHSTAQNTTAPNTTALHPTTLHNIA